LIIERFTRRDKGGKGISMGILSINMDNIVEEDGYGWSSESKTSYSETLERCNVDFGPNKEMGSMVRLGMMNVLDGKEQVM
jgi:hypothetical protein